LWVFKFVKFKVLNNFIYYTKLQFF